ncbi:hypothetical protein CEXT_704301 [Caerostris extrusa]|uniref:Uncharacterized protein n=1 Tax=Caerostris extrusa TaxID=172846 RepID=A0AAV4MG62_CAEEX|nr:hypothetical protein CEXT_704301 [Caerostris extrusa]
MRSCQTMDCHQANQGRVLKDIALKSIKPMPIQTCGMPRYRLQSSQSRPCLNRSGHVNLTIAIKKSNLCLNRYGAVELP